MLQYLLMCRSLTYAQRASKLLENVGISAIIAKVPKSVSENGCQYCIKVNERRLEEALELLSRNGFGPLKVFMQSDDGSVREVLK